MILPKVDKQGVPFLSYTQISSFITSKTDYIKRYFLNEPIQFRDYMDFGLKVGRALEVHDFSGFSKDEQSTLKRVTRLDEFEKQIRLDYLKYGFYLTGYIDTNSKDLTRIIDYKTGSANKVAEYEKDKYIQGQLYALAIKQQYGKMPKQVSVELIERYGNAFRGERLTVGKDIFTIPVDIGQARLKQVNELVVETAHEISKYYQIYKKLNK